MHQAIDTLNHTMKKTLFSVTISHMKRRKNPVSDRLAKKTMLNYKYMFHATSDTDISLENVKTFKEKIREENDPMDVIVWLDTLLS